MESKEKIKIFAHISDFLKKKKKKKRFLGKCSKPGHGNLVLITSTVQAEFSKLNFKLWWYIELIFFKFLHIMVFQDYCAMMALDKNRTEQSRTNTCS